MTQNKPSFSIAVMEHVQAIMIEAKSYSHDLDIMNELYLREMLNTAIHLFERHAKIYHELHELKFGSRDTPGGKTDE